MSEARFCVDLNCDLGESFGRYKLGLDEEVIGYVSSANVACGFHASDPTVMAGTVRLARAAGVAVGAHPGFPDLQGFGRRNMNMDAAELHDAVLYQVAALAGFCRAAGIGLQHVKPHGAMYNMAVKDMAMARAICRAVQEFDPELILLAPGGSCLQKAAAECGLGFACEVFADRGYQADGSLVPRSQPGAMIEDEDEAGYVKDYTLEELKKLDASKVRPGEWGAQEIPTFDEFCAWLATVDIMANVELKTSVIYYPEIERKCVDIIRKYGVESKILFSSFNHVSMLQIKKLAPEIPTGALVEIEGLMYAGYYCDQNGIQYYHPDFCLLSKEAVEECKAHGIGINVWTVNDLDSFEKLVEWGVEGVITNYPAVLYAWLNR